MYIASSMVYGHPRQPIKHAQRVCMMLIRELRSDCGSVYYILILNAILKWLYSRLNCDSPNLNVFSMDVLLNDLAYELKESYSRCVA